MKLWFITSGSPIHSKIDDPISKVSSFTITGLFDNTLDNMLAHILAGGSVVNDIVRDDELLASGME